MALEVNFGLRERQPLARSNAELPSHQIEPGDFFGHRMLDLQPRIHFDEPEAVFPQSAAAVGNELDRAGAGVTHGACSLYRRGAHLRPQAIRHAGRRRFLDDLLVTALQRAIALAEMNGVAVIVGENLDFNVARRVHVFLDEHTA